MTIDVELPLKGSCQCKNVTYCATDAPVASLACYCGECRKLSSSIVSTVLIFKTESICFYGELKTWERTSESGRRNVAYFCPVCGNRIYHFDPDMPGIVRLKSGTLDSVAVPEPQVNQWVSRKPHWVPLAAGVPKVLEGMSPEERKALTGFGFRPED